MRSNRLRQLLDAGEPSLGTHSVIPYPGVIEMAGHSGAFDYVEFVAEYAPYDLYTLENLARAVDLFDHMTSMIKVEQEPRTFITTRAIGAGIQNVLFADVRSVAEAEECVSAVRADTPETGGRHGSGDRRFAGYILESGTPAYVQALEDVVISLMIEKGDAVNDLEAMLSVKGIDMVTFGPSDYSMSIGRLGDANAPDIRKIEERVYKTALSMGIQPRAEIGTPDQAKRYLDMGVRHFAIGTDIAVLYQWWQENSLEMREMLGSL